MRKYRYEGAEEAILYEFHKLVKPGEEVEVDGEISHPDFKEVKKRKEAVEDGARSS